MAASVATEDTLKLQFHSMGATYAVYLKAVNQKNQTTKEGWVSCGSFFSYKAIRRKFFNQYCNAGTGTAAICIGSESYTQEGTITGGTLK